MSLIQKGIRCPNCFDEIYSNSRHDFVACKCDDCYIDGGFDYQRIGYKDKMPFTIERVLESKPYPFFEFEKHPERDTKCSDKCCVPKP